MSMHVPGSVMQSMVDYISGNLISSNGRTYFPDKPWRSRGGYKENCTFLAFHLGVVEERVRWQGRTYSRINAERLNQLREALLDPGLKNSPDIKGQLYSIMGKTHRPYNADRYMHPRRLAVF